jgi:hypothetical protein
VSQTKGEQQIILKTMEMSLNAMQVDKALKNSLCTTGKTNILFTTNYA